MSEPAAPTAEPVVVAEPAADAGGFIDSIDSAFAGFELDDAPANPTPAATPVADPVDDPADVVDPPASDPLADIDDAGDDSPTDWTPQAARRFKELKTELKTTKQLLQEREQALTERETRLRELDAVASNPAVEEMKTKLAEYEQKLLITDLENSPTYQELVQKPMAELVNEAYDIAEKYEVDGDSLIDAIALTDDAEQEEALSEILASASDRDKFRIYKIIEEVKPILAHRTLLRENAQAAILEGQELQQRKQTQELAERVQRRQEAASAVADRMRSKLTFIDSLTGVDLKAMAAEAAQTDPAAMDDVTATYQAIASKVFPKLARDYVALRAEVDSLTEKLAEYDKATPRAGGGSTRPAGAMSAPTDGKTFLDAVSAAFG